MKNLQFFPLSETAVLLDFGDEISVDKNIQILETAAAITRQPFPGLIETVPSYTTLTVYYDPLSIEESFPYKAVCTFIQDKIENLERLDFHSKTVEIPVCYDKAFALDIDEVAAHNGLSAEQVIERHSNADYHVYFLGFAPGFPFLGGMDPSLATPRKQSPRTSLPAGSVGIAGRQTGVYPNPTPGGWQIIGRTPISLLRLTESPPVLLQAGDRVRFYPISKQEFLTWED